MRAHPEIPERLHCIRLCLAAPQHPARQLRWQVAQLVPHERYQGRHHQGCAPLDQRRQLVAQGLAGTCGRAVVGSLECVMCPGLTEMEPPRQLLSGSNKADRKAGSLTQSLCSFCPEPEDRQRQVSPEVASEAAYDMKVANAATLQQASYPAAA